MADIKASTPLSADSLTRVSHTVRTCFRNRTRPYEGGRSHEKVTMMVLGGEIKKIV